MEKEVREILLNVAKREAQEIIKNARSTADEIMKEAEIEAERKLEKERNKLKTHLEIERSKRLGEAERIAKEKVLLSEHKIVDEVIEKTLHEFQKLRESPKEYKRVLTFLLDEVLSIHNGVVELHVNPKDNTILEEILKERRMEHKIIPDKDVNLGIVAFDTERGFIVYNTLEDRLEKAKAFLLENLKEVLLQV